jgi:hypothetical protein
MQETTLTTLQVLPRNLKGLIILSSALKADNISVPILLQRAPKEFNLTLPKAAKALGLSMHMSPNK